MFEAVTESAPLLYAATFVLGALFGSFLNVVIYRLPLMMEARWRRDCCELLEVEPGREDPPLNLATPNSHCPHCKAAIRAWQNIPVVSYLFLGGKCANCGARISLRYPAIELVTGLMTMALALDGMPFKKPSFEVKSLIKVSSVMTSPAATPVTRVNSSNLRAMDSVRTCPMASAPMTTRIMSLDSGMAGSWDA